MSNLSDYREATRMLALCQTALESKFDVNIIVAKDVCRDVLGAGYMRYRSMTGILGNWADDGATIEFNAVDILINGHIVPDFMFADKHVVESIIVAMVEHFKAIETKKNTSYIKNLIERYEAGQATLAQTKCYMQGMVDDFLPGYEAAERWLNNL